MSAAERASAGTVAREDRVTLILRDKCALRLDAIAVGEWLERGGRSRDARPSRQTAIRIALLEPDRAARFVVRLHFCERCEKAFGGAWCWEHEDRSIIPIEST